MLEVSLKATDGDFWPVIEHLDPRRGGRIVFSCAVIDNVNTVKGDISMLILTDSQQVDLAIKPVDKKGKAAQVDGVPEWSSSDPAVLTLDVAQDGLSAVAVAQDLGTAQVNVSADADLGAGVVTITGVLEITVVAGQAVSLGIIAGTPSEQE